MPQEPSRELSLYFHIDPQLARDRDCFHFHVLLEDSRPRTLQRDLRSLTGKLAPALSLPLVEWCLPPDGNQKQNVRMASGGTTGSICSIGRATVGTSHPVEVRGKIYAGGDGGNAPPNPPDPAIDPTVKRAQMVNCPSHPYFSTPLCIATIEPNFVFSQTYSNEIPGASCSSTGVANDLVLWLRFAGQWHKYAAQPFKGICAANTECDDSSGNSGESAITMVLSGPEKLCVISPGPSPKAGTEFMLHRVGVELTSIVTWQSCPKANPECEWKLWLKSNAGKPYATLALLAVDGQRLAVPLVWKCFEWKSGGASTFQLSTPAEAKQAQPTAKVAPV